MRQYMCHLKFGTTGSDPTLCSCEMLRGACNERKKFTKDSVPCYAIFVFWWFWGCCQKGLLKSDKKHCQRPQKIIGPCHRPFPGKSPGRPAVITVHYCVITIQKNIEKDHRIIGQNRSKLKTKNQCLNFNWIETHMWKIGWFVVGETFNFLVFVWAPGLPLQLNSDPWHVLAARSLITHTPDTVFVLVFFGSCVTKPGSEKNVLNIDVENAPWFSNVSTLKMWREQWQDILVSSCFPAKFFRLKWHMHRIHQNPVLQTCFVISSNPVLPTELPQGKNDLWFLILQPGHQGFGIGLIFTLAVRYRSVPNGSVNLIPSWIYETLYFLWASCAIYANTVWIFAIYFWYSITFVNGTQAVSLLLAVIHLHQDHFQQPSESPRLCW